MEQKTKAEILKDRLIFESVININELGIVPILEAMQEYAKQEVRNAFKAAREMVDIPDSKSEDDPYGRIRFKYKDEKHYLNNKIL